MKLVTVVIKPFTLVDVSEVKGFGRQKNHADLYRGAEYNVNFLLKIKIDISIPKYQLDEVMDVISKAAFTAKISDGKFFVKE